MRPFGGILVVAVLTLVSPIVAMAEGDFEEGLGQPSTSLHRSSPRQTVVGYLETARAGDFATAAHYLDLSGIKPAERPAKGTKLARRFKIVLDKTFWVDSLVVSDRENGAADDGLGPNQEVLTTLNIEGREIPIRLHVLLDSGGSRAWLFDQTTVSAINELYRAYGYGWLGDHLPATFFTIRVFEVELWQIIGLILLLGAGWVVARLFKGPLMATLGRAVRKTDVAWDDKLAEVVGGPLGLALFAGAVFFGSQWLGLAVPVQEGLAVFWRLIAVLILGWLLSSWVSVGAQVMVRTVGDDSGSLAKSFIPLFARVARFGVWALVAVLALDAAGVQVMGLIAGLGIGGLAVAFAAQKTIENFFGALAIASDRPFQKGDFVDIGGTSGTVEEVGLRSTRLRTTARTLVTIPNGSVSTSKVENLSVRDRILFNPTIGLIYGTTRAQIEFVIDEVKKLLAGHPKVYKESFRVRMASFGDSSLNIGILSWIDTTDYNEYTAVVEELNLEIMRIVEEAGTGFAFPSQTVYLGRDAGIDDPRAAEVGSEVERRRDAGELWLPEPPASREG